MSSEIFAFGDADPEMVEVISDWARILQAESGTAFVDYDGVIEKAHDEESLPPWAANLDPESMAAAFIKARVRDFFKTHEDPAVSQQTQVRSGNKLELVRDFHVGFTAALDSGLSPTAAIGLQTDAFREAIEQEESPLNNHTYREACAFLDEVVAVYEDPEFPPFGRGLDPSIN
jgi:hypothetical protein